MTKVAPWTLGSLCLLPTAPASLTLLQKSGESFFAGDPGLAGDYSHQLYDLQFSVLRSQNSMLGLIISPQLDF